MKDIKSFFSAAAAGAKSPLLQQQDAHPSGKAQSTGGDPTKTRPRVGDTRDIDHPAADQVRLRDPF